MLKLVKPHCRLKKQYLEMLGEWKAWGETPESWVLKLDCSNFAAMVRKLNGFSRGARLPKGFVPNSTFWALDTETDSIIGTVNIRHKLEGDFLNRWGNIGYSVRPGQRNRGFATEMLRLALLECKKMNMQLALVACYKENAASARTILKNGGILENEILEESTGKIIQRYWIVIGWLENLR